MASEVRVATITRFFSVDKRSKEEKAADRKSALAKWRDEENAKLARKKEAEAAAEAKRLASKRPVGRPKKVRQAHAVLVGQEGEERNLEDRADGDGQTRGRCQVLGVKDLWEGLCPEAPGVDVEAGHHISEQAPGRPGEAR
ncbi:unnamed protein product [Sphagnum tenellum]